MTGHGDTDPVLPDGHLDSALRAGFSLRPDAASSTDAPDAYGRYPISKEIGRGGVGVVYRGRDRDLDRDVALKVLSDRHADNPGMVRRFLDEARIGGQLQHPGIVPVYELQHGEDDRPFFTMKLIEGDTLADLLSRQDPSDGPHGLLSIFEQVCHAVGFAHAHGIVHRDLKPANVMVGPHGEVQVVDWGLAKVIGEADPAPLGELKEDPARSQVGSVMGTPSSMAPEQARGDLDAIGPASDVFALGSMLAEILTGRPAYRGSTAEMLQQAVAANLDEVMRELDDCGADPGLVDLTRRCLAEDPADRPDHAKLVAGEIAAFRTAVQQRARNAELAAAEAKGIAAQERRARRLTLGIGALALGLILVGVAWFVFEQHRRGRRADDLDHRARPLMESARQLATQARASELPDLHAWREAVRSAAMAEQVARAPEARESLRTMTRDLHDQVRGELHAAERRAEMIAQDDELLAEVEVITAGWGFDSWPESAARFERLYRDNGLDLDTMSHDEALQWVESRSRPVEIAEGLFGWIRTLAISTNNGVAPPEYQPLLRLIQDADPDPHRQRIRQAVIIGRPEDLVAMAQEPTEDFDERTIAFLGVVLIDMQQPALGEAILRQHLPRFPHSDVFHTFLALLASGQQDWANSLRHATAALSVDDNAPLLWSVAGISLAQLGEFREARPYLHRAVELRPDHGESHLHLGICHEFAGDLEAARASLERARSLQPDHGLTIYEYADFLGRHGDPEAAVEELLKATRIAMSARTIVEPERSRWQAAELLLDYGAHEHVHALLAEHASPATTVRLRLEGRTLLDSGQFSAALGALRQALRIGDGESAEWVAECKAMILIEDDLSGLVDGTIRPRGAEELARAARLCQRLGESGTALRLWTEALHLDVDAGALGNRSGRLQASACAFADGAGPETRKLVEQWARAELDWASLAVQRGVPRREVRERLWGWLRSADLSPARAPDLLADLPEAEAGRWRHLWEQLLARSLD